MQFLLSQEELDEQVKQAEALERLPSIEDLQEFCTLVSNNMPVVADGWKKGEIWGCILTVEREWYCDDCPAAKVCPYPNKHWSK